jgi:hypothetical protein
MHPLRPNQHVTARKLLQPAAEVIADIYGQRSFLVAFLAALLILEWDAVER